MNEQDDLLKEGSAYLEEVDKIHNKNHDVLSNKEEKIIPNLGKANASPFESTVGGSNDSHWKNIPLDSLPSQGLFYPEDTEITIKAATVTEVRQWSTIDENDRLSIEDALNFIIEKCTRIKIKGATTWLTWRDISELDRLALVFLIQEITFPNEQNSLFLKFACPGPCVDEIKWKDDVKVTSSMLNFINFPEEVMQFYDPQYKCFVVESAKLNETFYLYLPTIGVIEKLRARITQAKTDNRKIDKAFTTIAPYIIQDWHSFDQRAYNELSRENFSWHVNKFTFVTKFVNLLEGARRSMVSTTCPKCGKPVTSPLFPKSGFTIKDFFFISGGLNELI